MDYLTAFLICFLTVIAYLFYRETLNHNRSMLTRQLSVVKKQSQLDMDSILNNLDPVIEQTQKTYDEMLKRAAVAKTPEEIERFKTDIKPVKDKLDQMLWVQANQWWIRPAAPYVDSVLKSVLKLIQ